MTQAQRDRLRAIVIEIEADAMTLGFEARQNAKRNADKIRTFLDEFDTVPAPPRTSSLPPASETRP